LDEVFLVPPRQLVETDDCGLALIHPDRVDEPFAVEFPEWTMAGRRGGSFGR
jgi:hypothetical protein